MDEPEHISQILDNMYSPESVRRDKFREDSFRRGYHQGVANALDAMTAAGVKIPEQVREWERAVEEWRAHRPKDAYFPPTMGRPTNGKA